MQNKISRVAKREVLDMLRGRYRLRAGCLERVWSRSPVAPVLRRRPGGVLAIWQSHFSPFISSIAPVAYVLHAFRGHSGSWQSGNLTSGKPVFFRAWNSGWNRSRFGPALNRH